MSRLLTHAWLLHHMKNLANKSNDELLDDREHSIVYLQICNITLL